MEGTLEQKEMTSLSPAATISEIHSQCLRTAKCKLSYSAFLALQTRHSSFQFNKLFSWNHTSLYFLRCVFFFSSQSCLFFGGNSVSQCLYQEMPACVPSTPVGWAQSLTARRPGWWNHMLMYFLCCLTVTRARIPNGDLHLISNFNLALEYAEALCFIVLFSFLCFTLWHLWQQLSQDCKRQTMSV